MNHVNFQKNGVGLVVLHVVNLLSKESALTNACYDKVHLSYASRIPSTSWGCGALQYLYAYGFYGLLYFCGLHIFVMSPRQMRPTDRLGPLFTASMYESFVFSFVPPGFDDHNA